VDSADKYRRPSFTQGLLKILFPETEDKDPQFDVDRTFFQLLRRRRALPFKLDPAYTALAWVVAAFCLLGLSDGGPVTLSIIWLAFPVMAIDFLFLLPFALGFDHKTQYTPHFLIIPLTNKSIVSDLRLWGIKTSLPHVFPFMLTSVILITATLFYRTNQNYIYLQREFIEMLSNLVLIAFLYRFMLASGVSSAITPRTILYKIVFSLVWTGFWLLVIFILGAAIMEMIWSEAGHWAPLPWLQKLISSALLTIPIALTDLRASQKIQGAREGRVEY
jgi:hypothetical protein